MSQKAHENRKDFKFFEKTSVEEICLMYGGGCSKHEAQRRRTPGRRMSSKYVAR